MKSYLDIEVSESGKREDRNLTKERVRNVSIEEFSTGTGVEEDGVDSSDNEGRRKPKDGEMTEELG